MTKNLSLSFEFLFYQIIHGTYTIKAPVQIARFHSLQVLEVKKVPIHMVEGLSKLRCQLREIIITRSLQKLQVGHFTHTKNHQQGSL